MKALTRTLSLTALFIIFALPVQAQALLGENSAVVALEATPVEQVQETQLLDLINVAYNGEADLTAKASKLREIALDHPDADMRILAVTGLHAVGDETEMFKLLRAVDSEMSPKVRSTMIHALNDFFDGRYTEDDPRYVYASLINGQ